MHWNCRLVKDDKGIGIFEVHYNDDSKPIFHSRVKCIFCDNDWKELDEIACLREQIDMINEAFVRPVLNWPYDFADLDPEITIATGFSPSMNILNFKPKSPRLDNAD